MMLEKRESFIYKKPPRFYIQNYFEVMNMEMERPLDALNEARNKRVIVELKNKLHLIGKLRAFDIHINTVLEETEEVAEDGTVRRKLGKTFVRGDTIVMISLT